MRAPLAASVALLLAVPLSAQCPDGTPPPCGRTAAAAPAGGANSVAVLLFTNVTRDSTYAYLSEGLSSEIATSLAGVPRLEVRSPGVVRGLQRHAEGDPRLLGRRLGVRYVVEGDYQRSGERIRVSVRLVTVASGTQRWSSAYTRSSADLLAVQEDVAREVATSIAGQLLPQERTRFTARASVNPEAWDHFLRGNYQLAKRTQDGIERAVEEYAQASRLDPAFASPEARIALAWALYIDWAWPTPLPQDSMLARGLAAADRAIARDSTNADAYMARGYLHSFLSSRDYAQVLRDFDRSLALDPRNAEALHQYASKLGELNDQKRAIAMERRALEVDPDRPVSYMVMGKSYMALRRDDEARRALDSSLTLDPLFYTSSVYRGQLALVHGDIAAACRDADAAMHSALPGDGWRVMMRAACQAAQGDTASAVRTYTEMAAPYDTARFVPEQQAIALAYVAGRLRRADDALRWLEHSRPSGAVLWSELLGPGYDPLRGDPRFQRFMDTIRPLGAR